MYKRYDGKKISEIQDEPPQYWHEIQQSKPFVRAQTPEEKMKSRELANAYLDDLHNLLGIQRKMPIQKTPT